MSISSQEFSQIKSNFAYYSRTKKYNEKYPEEHAYFDKLLNQVSLVDNLSDIDFIIENKLYSKGNISIILDDDFKTKINTNGITDDTFMKTIKENIEDISKYSDLDKYNKAKFDINYDLRNDIIKQNLAERKQKITEITQDPVDNQRFLNLFEGMKDTREIFDLFDFDLNDDLELIQSKPHEMYLSRLNQLFGDISRDMKKRQLASLDQWHTPTITKHQLVESGLWHKPVLNSLRDYNLSLEEGKQMSDFTQYFITPEIRLMNFLIRNNFIKDKIDQKQIDYILSVYRCFVIGNNYDIKFSFKNNNRYHDVWPCITPTECGGLNNVCTKYGIDWSLTNNAIGTLLAARRRIIFPYMIISDNLEVSRYETIKFDSNFNIGIIILKLPIKDKRPIYHYYYMRLLKNNIGFSDIYNNTIHFKSSPSAQPRVQLLESKWAIYKLLWYLSFRKIIPYTQKDQCDIFLYKTNRQISIPDRTDKDLYLLSIYNVDEIKKMYNDLLNSIIIFKSTKLYTDLKKLIQTFIDELDSYTILTKYRLFNIHNCNKLFVWEIDPSERLQWGDFDGIQSCIDRYKDNMPHELSRITCIKSNLYISMDDNILNYDKLELNKDSLSVNLDDSLPDILEEPFDQYVPIKYYYKAIDYNYNESYKEHVDLYKKNLNRLYVRILYKFIDYRSFDAKLPLAYDKESESFTIGNIPIRENLKHYYKLLKYMNDSNYKSLVDKYIDDANRINDMYFQNKYLKYKQKFLKLKLYINNI